MVNGHVVVLALTAGIWLGACATAGPAGGGARTGEAVVVADADCGMQFEIGQQWKARIRSVESGHLADSEIVFIAAKTDSPPFAGHFRTCQERGVRLRMHRVNGGVPSTYTFLAADGTDWIIDGVAP